MGEAPTGTGALWRSGPRPESLHRAAQEAPFFAIPILLGNNGTKGGLRTDGTAALSGSTAPSSTACSPRQRRRQRMGPGYPGTGGSLGPAMTDGLFAGRAAASGVEA